MAARMIHVKLCGRDGGGVVGVWKEQGLVPGKPRVCGQIIYGDAKLKSFAPFEKQRRSRAPTTPIYVLGCGRPVDRLSLHPARESFELRPATRSTASHRRDQPRAPRYVPVFSIGSHVSSVSIDPSEA